MMSSIWNSSNVGKKVHITVAWLPRTQLHFYANAQRVVHLGNLQCKVCWHGKGVGGWKWVWQLIPCPVTVATVVLITAASQSTHES